VPEQHIRIHAASCGCTQDLPLTQIFQRAYGIGGESVPRIGIILAVGRAPKSRSRGANMWNWFNCYLSGRHEFGVWCEPGAIFLRCIHCGKRSSGWEIHAKPQVFTPSRAETVATRKLSARVIPFGRVAAR
jgi:hypothetical protein